MGLEEHIKAGAQLTRDTIIITAPTGSGSVDLGPAFAVLKIQTDTPIRLRLYDNEQSRDTATEISRPFGLSADTSIALIGDFSMSAAGAYEIAPAVFGFCSSSNPSSTFYRVENATGQPSQSIVRITRYLLEDRGVPPTTGSFYTINNRRVISIDYSGTNIPSASIVSGTISTGVSTVPQTYMLISASLDNVAHKVRFRLYATSSAIFNATERTRPFTTEPSEVVALLTDVVIDDGSETVYFTPKIFGANLENMGNDLLLTAESTAKISGDSEIYYYLQNLTSVAINPVVSMSLYALED